MKFNEKVLAVRGKLLISQQELAREVGVSYATINRREQGHNEPSFIMQKKFEVFCEKRGILINEQ